MEHDRGHAPLTFRSAWRLAPPIGVSEAQVHALLLATDGDRRFAKAFDQGLDALEPCERRGALAGVTGHVAESLVQVLAAEEGWQPFWNQTGVGRAGVDLLALTPETSAVVAIEVKSTLRAGAVPRLGRRKINQMSDQWLSRAGNVGMANWELGGADVHRVIATVDFAARQLRLVMLVADGCRPAADWADVELLLADGEADRLG